MKLRPIRLAVSISAFLAVIAAFQPARANEAQDRVLEIAALANLYGERCQNWKVNWFTHIQMLETVKLEIDQLTKEPAFSRYVAAMEKAFHKVEPLADQDICRQAEAEFGPTGSIAPGLMSESLAVRGLNRLFEMLD